MITVSLNLFIFDRPMSLFWREIAEKNKPNRVIATSAVYLLLTTVLELTGCITPISNYIYPLLRISQGIAIWMAADIFKPFGAPSWWAKLSFPIYVMHSMILESLEKGVLLCLGRTNFGAVIDFIFAPVLTILIIIAASAICRKYFQSVWSVMTGGRGL